VAAMPRIPSSEGIRSVTAAAPRRLESSECQNPVQHLCQVEHMVLSYF
jgi:hypothetical protein